MNKTSPIELRESLKLSKELVSLGIGFVPIPYENEKQRQKLMSALDLWLQKLADLIEKQEKKEKKKNGK